jgi:uncharacterized repeat protein (TIGR01451 family)
MRKKNFQEKLWQLQSKKGRKKLYKLISIFSASIVILNTTMIASLIFSMPSAVYATQVEQPQAATNPILERSCGIDIALVLDSSGSIDSTELGQMRTSFKGFVDSFLPDTPTQFSVTDFDTTARVIGDFSGDATEVKSFIDSPLIVGGQPHGGATNWEDGLIKAQSTFDPRPTVPNLIIFASDGNPNKYNPNQGSGNGFVQAALNAAITKANLIKTGGTRIITLGIGASTTPANLEAISSADAYYSADNFSGLAETLQEITTSLCGGTITVHKVIDQDGDLETTTDQTDGEGWQFTVAGEPKTTDVSGQTSPEDVDSGQYNITENVQSGYALVDADCNVENSGLDGDTLYAVQVGPSDVVTCTFYNRPLVCGDGIVSPGEACEGQTQQTCVADGNYAGQQTCNQCQFGSCEPTERCGDGLKNGPEECDGSSGVGAHQSCSETCTIINLPYCGDDLVNQDNEQCDGEGSAECRTDAGYSGLKTCNSDCQWNSCVTQESCGDGAINDSEQCDTGSTNGMVCQPEYGLTCDYCDSSCHSQTVTGAFCGDKTVNGDETCDGGSQACTTTSGYAGTQTCHSECGWDTCETTLSCGDDVKNGTEQCDNQDGIGAHQSCSRDCLLINNPYCGDGLVNNEGEQCDDGNTASGDGCSSTCQTETPQSLHSISGMKFNDANDNGTRDEGESGLAGWTIYLDSNDNGLLDNEETSTQTNSDGNYSFADLSDDDYVVREVQQSGWTQTKPADNGKYNVTIDGDNPSGKNFGNHQNEVLQCTGSGTYTVNADFDMGSLINVNHTPSDQVQLSDQVNAFNFIWVSVSSKGTMVKINTDTGAVVGEYWTSPASQGVGNGNTSRTTVDKDGSVWVANRNGVYNGHGSVAHIGLVENGQCEDRNGNGVIDTSTGQGDIKPWADISGDRHVATAQDECIVHYVETSNGDARHISVTADNNVWVSGTSGRNFDLIKGGKWNTPGSGDIIRHEASVGYGGYGGLITASGIIWSTNPLIRWDTAYPLVAPNGTSTIGYSHDSYGICIDHQGNVWNTSLSGGAIRKFAPDGSLLGTFNYHANNAQGCAVDQNDNIWVAHSLWGNSVGHLLNDGTWVGNITVGTGPTGVSVDANNKVWVTNMYSQTVSRIDPALGDLGADGVTKIGAVDFTSVDLGGQLYNYSDMTGSTLSGKAQSGTWTVVHDGSVAGYPWRDVSWTAALNGGSLSVTVATSSDGVTFGAPQTITSGQSLASLTSRYLKIVVSFDRSDGGNSPVLYDLTATRECGQTPPPPPPPVCTSNCGGGGGGSTPYWLLGTSTSLTVATSVLGVTLKPALQLTKAVGVKAAFAGTKNVKYTLTVENTGNASAFGVVLKDTLPKGLTFADGSSVRTWNIGELKAGEKKTFDYTVNVSSELPAADYTNTAELTADGIPGITAKAAIKVLEPKVLGVKLPNTGFDMTQFILLLLAMSGSFYFSRKQRAYLK